jgi:hypothetical protein
MPEPESFEIKDDYHVDDFFKYHGMEFDGISTILMSCLSIGDPKMGMRVVPIFRTVNPTYTITDLSWVEDGVKAENLPEGFSFG